MSAKAFPFNQLPYELRQIIWREALVLDGGPGMMPFTTRLSPEQQYANWVYENWDAEDAERVLQGPVYDLWTPDELTDKTEISYFVGDDGTIQSSAANQERIEYPGKSLLLDQNYEGYIVINIPPLILVNREARKVTLDWADSNNIALIRNVIGADEVRQGWDTHAGAVFARPFEPKRDYLYVSDFYQFLTELRGRIQPAEEYTIVSRENVYHVAASVRDVLFCSHLPRLVEDLPNLQSLVCLVDNHPNSRWKLRSTMKNGIAVAQPAMRPVLLSHGVRKLIGPNAKQEEEAQIDHEKYPHVEAAINFQWYPEWRPSGSYAKDLRSMMELIYDLVRDSFFCSTDAAVFARVCNPDTGTILIDLLPCRVVRGI